MFMSEFQEGLGVETSIERGGIEHTLSITTIRCESKEDADAILILTKFCPSASFKSINFYDWGKAWPRWDEGDMGAEGWSALGKALSQLHNGVARFDCFKSQMDNAKMEDVKVIWDCLSEEWNLSLGEGDEIFYKNKGEDGWLALEKCLSMTDEEWWFLSETTSDEENWEPQEQWLVEMRGALGRRIRRSIWNGGATPPPPN